MKRKILFVSVLIILATACSTVKLEPASFSWPIETVLTTDPGGIVSIERYATTFNAANLFIAEFGEKADYAAEEIHVIRGLSGDYFMTAAGFKNVYIFEVEDGAFVLDKKILINKDGIANPAFNQRDQHIEVLDGNKIYKIDSEGIIGN